jgi:hypothetical protein
MGACYSMILEKQQGKKIEFVATVYKVQTLVDNGIRVTLDLSEDEILAAVELIHCHAIGVVLKVEAKPE